MFCACVHVQRSDHGGHADVPHQAHRSTRHVNRRRRDRVDRPRHRHGRRGGQKKEVGAAYAATVLMTATENVHERTANSSSNAHAPGASTSTPQNAWGRGVATTEPCRSTQRGPAAAATLCKITRGTCVRTPPRAERLKEKCGRRRSSAATAYTSPRKYTAKDSVVGNLEVGLLRRPRASLRASLRASPRRHLSVVRP